MLEPLYDTIHSKIITASVLGIDETTFPIDGKQDGCGLQEAKQNHITL